MTSAGTHGDIGIRFQRSLPAGARNLLPMSPLSSDKEANMAQKKTQTDRRVGRRLVTIFVIALLVAIGYVIITQSGIIPGDAPTQEGGVGPGSGG